MNGLAFLLQGTAQEFTALGIGGTIAGFMFYFYREDRKRAEDRLAELSGEFRKIISDNTTAVTRLTDSLQKIAYCPYRSEMADEKSSVAGHC